MLIVWDHGGGTAGGLIVDELHDNSTMSTKDWIDAIKASGVSCVIAETFARIFFRNAIDIGLPIIECREASERIGDQDEVSVDFDTGNIGFFGEG